MDVREKLIELIGATQYGNSLVGENFQEGFIATIADNLIANGVTIPVRCEGCKYWGGVTFGNRCKYWSNLVDGWVHFTNPDDFCSYGERRTE